MSDLMLLLAQDAAIDVKLVGVVVTGLAGAVGILFLWGRSQAQGRLDDKDAFLEKTNAQLERLFGVAGDMTKAVELLSRDVADIKRKLDAS